MTTVNTSEGASATTAKLAATALNHLTHGGRSQTLFLPTESPAEFFALLESAFQKHQPSNPEDAGLVTDSVLARWLVSRRQSVLVEREAHLYKQKPQSDDWTSAEINDLAVLDRYRTQAERALKRALANLGHISKDTVAERRWQEQHALQKQRFSLECERFQLAKQREIRLAEKLARKEMAQTHKREDVSPSADSPLPNPDHPAASNDSRPQQFKQVVYIGLDRSVPVVYETTPSNQEIRAQLTTEDFVTRIYNFAGPVPEKYRHLITPDAYTFANNTSVRKTYSFEEWNLLVEHE